MTYEGRGRRSAHNSAPAKPFQHPRSFQPQARNPTPLGIGLTLDLPLLPPISLSIGRVESPAPSQAPSPPPPENGDTGGGSGDTGNGNQGNGNQGGTTPGNGNQSGTTPGNGNQGGATTSNGNSSPTTPAAPNPPSPTTNPTANNPPSGNSSSSNSPSPNGSTSRAQSGSPTGGSSVDGNNPATSRPTAGLGSGTGSQNLGASLPASNDPGSPNNLDVGAGNVGHIPGSDLSGDGIQTNSFGSTTRVSSGSGGSSLSNTAPVPSPTGTDTFPGSPSPDDPGGKPLSTGAIIAIVLTLFIVFLLIAFLVLRRNRKRRRAEQANHWWFTRTKTQYRDEPLVAGAAGVAGAASRRQSQRSSFATTFDRSLSPVFALNFTQGLPALPPMAEVRRSQNMFEYPIPANNGNSTPERRHSGSQSSQHSSSSRSSSFFFASTTINMETASAQHAGNSVATFTFPRPPPEAASGTSSAYFTPRTRPSSAEQSIELGPGAAPLHIHEQDPFSDPNYDYEEGSTSTHTTNPFTATTISTIHGDFNEVEFVRRLFVGTRFDELSVQPGDQVRVLKVFDDGWVLVETSETDVSLDTEKGLIPVDCFREPGQDWKTFLNTKRIDSYLPMVA